MPPHVAPRVRCVLLLALAGSAVAEAQPTPARASQCGPLIAMVRAAIERGGACQSVADCAMYPGGLRGVTDCGALTDRATAAEIERLSRQLILVCRPGALREIACGTPSCMAACEAGRCVCHGDPAATPPRPPRRRGPRAR